MESAYSGDGKFIFFSYSHDDQEMLEPFFNVLAKKYNVWHDKDINYGGDWENIIKDHVRRSSLFMFLITPGSLSSDYCKKEIRWSIENDIPFLGIVVNRIDVPKDFKEKQMCNLYEFFSFEKAVDEIARRNSAINITLREEYLKKQNDKTSKKDDYNKALANVLQRRKFFGIRSIGSFEDFSRVMSNDFGLLDDLEFATPTLPEEIFNRCSLQKSINSKFMYLLGICYYLGIGTDIDIKLASLCLYTAVMNNAGLSKNMFNIAIWTLYRIGYDLGAKINYGSFDEITLGKWLYYYNQIYHFNDGKFRIDPKELMSEILEDESLSSANKNILLAKLLLAYRPVDEEARKYYDLAIAEGSESAIVFKEELNGDVIYEMKFRMIRGYSNAYNRYSRHLKNKSEFDLNNEEQYNFCLNSARLGNELAITDFYEWFFKNKNSIPFFDSLMNFLFDQGVKKGCRHLIQLQQSILKENKASLKKIYNKKYKELIKLDKEYVELADKVDYLLKEIINQYGQNKD